MRSREVWTGLFLLGFAPAILSGTLLIVEAVTPEHHAQGVFAAVAVGGFLVALMSAHQWQKMRLGGRATTTNCLPDGTYEVLTTWQWRHTCAPDGRPHFHLLQGPELEIFTVSHDVPLPKKFRIKKGAMPEFQVISDDRESITADTSSA